MKSQKRFFQGFLWFLGVVLAASPAPASSKWTYDDPAGDDNGPGTYTYPTDAVYTPGSFDLRQVTIKEKKGAYEVTMTFGARLENPWSMTAGFSLQMAQVYFDFDHKGDSGHLDSLPGMNVQFEPESLWEKCVIIGPQPESRVRAEIKDKLPPETGKDVIVPTSVRPLGNRITAIVAKKDLGTLPEGFGVQVLINSNEGFPSSTEILSRPVNEYEGPHRFGGGSDYNGDPHVLDCLMAPAKGGKEEIEAQHAVLKEYVSGFEPEKNKLVRLPMVSRLSGEN